MKISILKFSLTLTITNLNCNQDKGHHPSGYARIEENRVPPTFCESWFQACWHSKRTARLHLKFSSDGIPSPVASLYSSQEEGRCEASNLALSDLLDWTEEVHWHHHLFWWVQCETIEIFLEFKQTWWAATWNDPADNVIWPILLHLLCVPIHWCTDAWPGERDQRKHPKDLGTIQRCSCGRVNLPLQRPKKSPPCVHHAQATPTRHQELVASRFLGVSGTILNVSKRKNWQ